jgi:ketosteroid isomerase-like protein
MFETGERQVPASKSVPVAVTTYFDSLNGEDWDSLRTIWAEDTAVVAVGARPRHGVDDAMNLYMNIFKHWSRHLDIPGRTLIDGDTAVVEVHFVGTTKDGRDVEFDAVDVIDIEDGRVKKLTTWYDTAKVLALIAGTS